MVADITLTDSLPVYVQANKAKVAKDGDNLEISVNDQVASRPRIAEISHLALFGNVYLTTPTLHELMRREVAVSWHGYGGGFLGYTAGLGNKDVDLRRGQFRGAANDNICLTPPQGGGG